MPSSITSNYPIRPEDLIRRLNSTHTPCEAKLKALRDLKNQIIGNRTKKLAFLKLDAVPSVVAILSFSAAAAAIQGDSLEFHESVLVQSAAAIGSFTCGLDAGIKAVLDAGAFPLMLKLIFHHNEKLSPRITPKLLQDLPENGRELNLVIELVNDKNPRTRLLACTRLINIRNTSVSYRQNSGIKNKLVLILLELLDDPGQVGNEAPFVLCNLIAEKEDMQKIAFDASAVEKCYENLQKGSFQAKHLQGIFLALADMCSKLEGCRDRVLHLKVFRSDSDLWQQWPVFVDPAVTSALGGAAATSHGRRRLIFHRYDKSTKRTEPESSKKRKRIIQHYKTVKNTRGKNTRSSQKHQEQEH